MKKFTINTESGEVILEPRDNPVKIQRNVAIEDKLVALVVKHFGVSKLEDINLDDKAIYEDYERLLKNMVMSCKSCKLAVETDYSHCAPIYNRNPVAVFIGRSPSKSEALCNQIVAEETQCGRIFDQYLNQLGLSRSDVAVLNMAQCHTKGNRPPESECLMKCRAYKKLEFYLIGSCKMIFLMGNDAVKWMYGNNHPGVLNVHGVVYSSVLKASSLGLTGDDMEVVVIPVVHPNHLAINPELRMSVAKILKIARAILEQLK